MILIKLVIQVMMVIFRNLLILVNLVISGISSDYCESDASGDSGAYGPECDIRENFDTNECPNIFVSTKLRE